MKKVIKKTVAKAQMGTADKPRLYLDNPYSTRKNPTDYLEKGGAVKKTAAKKPMVKSKKK